MAKPTIFLIGEVSSGKSSFLNSFAGGYISNSSIQRETFNPLWYQFSTAGKEENITKITAELEERHKQNEIYREKIQELKEEQISSLDYVCDDTNSIPVRHNLDDINIIDFPGLNDSDDKTNKFLKAIENRIHQADLLIYITEATSAFVSSSETMMFRNITKMVERCKAAGQFVDIIILVNKFDNVNDDDLNKIYQRISSKILVSQDKIFRCSSHKLFIRTIILNKLNVLIPKHGLKEITKILQNSNVSISKNIKDNLQKDSILKYDDISFAEDLEDNGQDQTAINNCGDWDNVLNYIKLFQQEIPINRLLTLESFFDIWIDKISKYYQTLLGEENQDYIINFYKEMEEMHRRLQQFDTDQNIFNKKIMILLQKIDTIFSKTINCIHFELLKMMVQYISTNSDRELINHIAKYVYNSKYLQLSTHVYVFYIMYASIDVDILFKWLIKILANSEVYGNIKTNHISINSKQIFKSFSKSTKIVILDHKSWFIHNLINSENTLPIEVIRLLKLSLTPIIYLREYERMNMIPYELLKMIDSDYRMKFRFIINNSKKPSSCLEHTMFNLNDSTVDAFVRTYNADKKLFPVCNTEHELEDFSDSESDSESDKEESQQPFETVQSTVVSPDISNLDIVIETPILKEVKEVTAQSDYVEVEDESNPTNNLSTSQVFESPINNPVFNPFFGHGLQHYFTSAINKTA